MSYLQPFRRPADLGKVPGNLSKLGSAIDNKEGVVPPNTFDLNSSMKQPKLYQDLNKIEEIYDRFEMKIQENANTRFTPFEQRIDNISRGTVSPRLLLIHSL